ncbi:uncharacterized protein LOC101237644 isoform X2 [Hydra vulgaris]|uniref:uncharacterized protein LOC101237644 isoform X2 n=1 Tax=Hydra vulgaris TaxID=6087 RepID=UPI001F5F3FB1|nr:uncharacterized protein LOC101237644 isoform X2 [Hydra vulgaris]
MKRNFQRCFKNYIITEAVKSIWVGTIFGIFSLITPFAIAWLNPLYFSSQNAYPSGADVYFYINKALYLKDVITYQTSFLNDYKSLENQIYTEPIPSLFTALAMIIFNRFGSPLCIFRCVIVFLVSLIPLTLYLGVYRMVFSQTQGIFVALLLFCINSKFQFGFELNAVFLQGLFNQLFGMVVVPITVSKMYNHGMNWKKSNQDTSALYLCLIYCCHIPSGIICSLASLSAFITFFITKEFKLSNCISAAMRFLGLHIRVVLYLSWWIVATIISYPYLKSSCQETIHSISHLINIVINGSLFGDKNHFFWFTSLVLIGLFTTLIDFCSVFKLKKFSINNQYYSVWLFLMTFFVVLACLSNLFLTLNNFVFLIHFCGLLLASTSLQLFFQVFYKFVAFTSLFKALFILIISSVSIKHFTLTISENVLTEGNENFQNALRALQNESTHGRIFIHEKLGTGDPWDIINIPSLTGKLGVLESCHDSSNNPVSYYLDMVAQNSVAEKFENFLRLYNIKYVAGYSSFIEKNFNHIADLEHVIKYDDFEILKVYEDEEKYGFFSFVHLPGYVDGNKKNLHQAVVQSLDLYSQNLLLYLNPRRNSAIRKQNVLVIQTVSKRYFGNTISNSPGSIVNWKLNGQGIDSIEAVQYLENIFANMPLYSTVIEEKYTYKDYHVLVQVMQPSSKVELMEHLLFKFSYHPFWQCVYIPVSNTYRLRDYDSNRFLINRTLTAVHHVTPNLMAITLPEGRFHVILFFRIPGILKIAALIFIGVVLCKLFYFLSCALFAITKQKTNNNK